MFGKEPAVVLGALSEVVRAVIPTLIIFGMIQWTSEQVAQVMLLVGVIVGFLNILLTRSQVVATETADKQIDVALKMPSTATKGQVIAEVKSQE